MRYGQTTAQRAEEESARQRKVARMFFERVKKFAWIPVIMEDGRTLWWEYYWRGFSDYFSFYEVVQTDFRYWARRAEEGEFLRNYYTPRLME